MASKHHAERREVEAMIREAFRGVSREDGVSWSEAEVIDDYGTEAEAMAARASDKESCWEDLVSSSRWDHDSQSSRFSFLDAIGFRYYLAPAMIQCIRAGESDCLPYILTVYSHDKYGRKQVGLLNTDQAIAVSRFLRLMTRVSASLGEDVVAQWQAAYDSHWHKYDKR